MTKKKISFLILIGVLILLVIATTFYGRKYFASLKMQNDFTNLKVDEDIAESLTNLNWFETYIAPYNLGIVHFMQANYTLAEKDFHEASESGTSSLERLCKVRYNYSLAEARAFNLTMVDDALMAKVDDLLELLYTDDCAIKNGQGKEPLAQTLADRLEALKKLEQETEESSDEGDGDGDGDDEGEETETTDAATEQALKQELLKMRAESNASRQGDLEFSRSDSFDYYDGEQW